MTTLLLAFQLAVVVQRTYHEIPLERLALSRWTHVKVCALVTYVRKQQDGDWHVTLDNGKAKVVAEIIPAIPLAPPKKGQRVCVWGIARRDGHHGWYEVHPVERLEITADRF